MSFAIIIGQGLLLAFCLAISARCAIVANALLMGRGAKRNDRIMAFPALLGTGLFLIVPALPFMLAS